MSYDTDESLKPTKWPENYPLTYEARGQGLLNDIYKVLCDVRLHLQNIEHELRKPPVDMDDFVYSPRKPAAALKPAKARK